jgi:hypothetical protein
MYTNDKSSVFKLFFFQKWGSEVPRNIHGHSSSLPRTVLGHQTELSANYVSVQQMRPQKQIYITPMSKRSLFSILRINKIISLLISLYNGHMACFLQDKN